MLLDYYSGQRNDLAEKLTKLNSGTLLDREDSYRQFLEETTNWIEVESTYLVHAGFNLTASEPFEDADAMQNTRYMVYDGEKTNNQVIIHGHVPFPLNIIERNLDMKYKIIPLDNGCVYPGRYLMGNLLCLNLSDRSLIVQPNLD